MMITTSMMLLSSCASLDNKKQANKLEQSLRQYSAALRWGRYRDAANFHITKEEKLTKVDIDYLENFSVTSVEFISKTIILDSKTDNAKQALIIFEVSYYHEAEAYVKKLKLNQTWWYNQATERWLIETGFPKFK